MFVDLDALGVLPARETAALFDPALGLRVIVAATDERRARARLEHHRDRLRAISLTPLADRADDVPHLLQFHWATVLDAPNNCPR